MGFLGNADSSYPECEIKEEEGGEERKKEVASIHGRIMGKGVCIFMRRTGMICPLHIQIQRLVNGSATIDQQGIY